MASDQGGIPLHTQGIHKGFRFTSSFDGGFDLFGFPPNNRKDHQHFTGVNMAISFSKAHFVQEISFGSHFLRVTPISSISCANRPSSAISTSTSTSRSFTIVLPRRLLAPYFNTSAVYPATSSSITIVFFHWHPFTVSLITHLSLYQ